jgi:hypothetical protein
MGPEFQPARRYQITYRRPGAALCRRRVYLTATGQKVQIAVPSLVDGWRKTVSGSARWSLMRP